MGKSGHSRTYSESNMKCYWRGKECPNPVAATMHHGNGTFIHRCAAHMIRWVDEVCANWPPTKPPRFEVAVERLTEALQKPLEVRK